MIPFYQKMSDWCTMRFLYIPVLYLSPNFYITLIQRQKAIYYIHKTHRYLKMLAKLCKTTQRPVRNIGCGLMHHPILWSRKRLWDGSITTLTSTDSASLSYDVIRTVWNRVMGLDIGYVVLMRLIGWARTFALL